MKIEDGKVIPGVGDFKISPVSDFKPTESIQGVNEIEFEVLGVRSFWNEMIQKAQNILNEGIALKYSCDSKDIHWVNREDLDTIIVFLKDQAIGHVKTRQFFDYADLQSKIGMDFIPFPK